VTYSVICRPFAATEFPCLRHPARPRTKGTTYYTVHYRSQGWGISHRQSFSQNGNGFTESPSASRRQARGFDTEAQQRSRRLDMSFLLRHSISPAYTDPSRCPRKTLHFDVYAPAKPPHRARAASPRHPETRTVAGESFKTAIGSSRSATNTRPGSREGCDSGTGTWFECGPNCQECVEIARDRSAAG
jgi:hypothetical protein